MLCRSEELKFRSGAGAQAGVEEVLDSARLTAVAH